MVEKSDDLRRALLEIDNLLYALRNAHGENNLEQDDIDFLQRSRRSIVTLLEARRKLNLHNIVSLKAWRYGSAVTPQYTAEDDATTARHSRPPRDAVRPHLVAGTGNQLSCRTRSRS